MTTNWHKNIIRIAIIVGLILLIPLVLQLTIGTGIDGQGFNWRPGDFLVMGALFFGTGLAIDFAMRKLSNFKQRLVVIVAIIFTLFLIWAELAVGILGTPFAGS